MYKSLSVIGILLTIVVLTQSGCQPGQAGTDKQEPGMAPDQQQIQQTVTGAEPALGQDVPAISIENPVHDFGEMGPGAKDKCEFKFKNAGTGTLIIDRVQSTCGCTVPQLKKKEYAPGEEGVVSVSFHAPSTKTNTTKHLYIISNDPKTPRAELTIKAEVVVKVEVSPENVELRLDEDNSGMSDIILKSLDSREFSIKSITVSPQNVIRIPFDATQKAKEFVLKPVVDKQKLNETNTGIIQINTDHPQSGTLVVRYHATPQYEVSRPRIILQNVTPGVPIVKDVLIRSNYNKDVEIESVESRNGYMEIESQEKDGQHLQLQVKITPPEQETSSRRYITDELKIMLKDGTTLTIRCSGWFKLK